LASKESIYSLPVIEGTYGEYVKHIRSLPRYTKFKFPKYTFLPNQIGDLGLTTIKGELWNDYNFISFEFKVNVSNEAPFL